MSKHTPGPWDWDGSVLDEDREIIGAGLCVARVYEDADARLIAAAPKMLETLKRLVREFDESDFWSTVGSDRWRHEAAQARATIAEAEGGAEP